MSIPAFRRRDHATPATGSVSVLATPVTDARTHCVHLVSDAGAAAGRANAGRYVALCGAEVLAASLTTPESGYCGSCTSNPGRPPIRVSSPRLALGGRPAFRTSADQPRRGEGFVGRHEDEEEKRRHGDGQPSGPINPDTVREPKPGKRGQ